MIRFVAIAAALMLPAAAAAQQAGEVTQIDRDYQTTQKDNRGSTGTTSDEDGFVERVIAVRDGGVELEYDITNEGDRSSQWHFPVRIFKPAHGPLKLVDAAELEARVDPWLKSGGMTRAACGHWIFTWNAFRIDCDPQSVLETIEAIQLDPADLREGAPFSIHGARGSAPLTRRGRNGFTVELPLDSDAVRQDRIHDEIVLAELSGKQLSEEDARRAHAGEAISGTVDVTFDLDPDGHVGRRTKVVKVEIRSADGKVETRTATEIFTRHPAAKPPRDPRLI